MTQLERDIFIIGGPNGAGKTTAARVLLPEFLHERNFLNADDIAREISPANPEAAALAAGREFLVRMHRLIREQGSFALETTCAGRSYLRIFEQCRNEGWRIVLLYFWLPSAELSARRVACRVAEGGHGIPLEVIHRRYRTGIWNMCNLYLPLADEAEIYDNSLSPRVLIAQKRKGRGLQVCDAARWGRIEEVSR
ncbi:MAG: AAA family ATPase [Acidobacteriota bacterium]